MSRGIVERLAFFERNFEFGGHLWWLQGVTLSYMPHQRDGPYIDFCIHQVLSVYVDCLEVFIKF